MADPKRVRIRENIAGATHNTISREYGAIRIGMVTPSGHHSIFVGPEAFQAIREAMTRAEEEAR